MLGDNIKKYRKENNMSQDELAEKLNVTRQSVSLWENDQTQPSLENIVALAKLFNVSTDELLSVSGTEAAAGIADNSAVNTAAGTAPKAKSKSGNGLIITLIVFAVSLIVIAAAVFIAWKKGAFGGVPKNPPPDSECTSGSVATSELADTSETETTAAETTEPEKTTESETEKVTTAVITKAATTTKKSQKAAEPKDIYGTLKNFVVKNGVLNGDHCYYTNTADTYGGYASEDFSLYYWGDTDTVEFCLHSPLDSTYSINFYLRVPKSNNGTFEYITSYYYRSNGVPVYEAKGTVTASEFSDKYPLLCTKYTGSTDMQDDFMEMSRVGICDTIKCLKQFLAKEKTGCTFADFGFRNF